jgi:hypothetical protein
MGWPRSSRERHAPARGGLPLFGWRSPKPVSERLPTSGRSGDTASDRTPDTVRARKCPSLSMHVAAVVLSVARVAQLPAPAAAESRQELRHEPDVSGRGYSKAAPLPPADLPVEGRAMPSGQVPDAPAAKPAESAPSPAPAKPVVVPIAPLE